MSETPEQMADRLFAEAFEGTASVRPAVGRSVYDPLIQKAAAKYGIDPALFSRLIQQESGFNPRAISPKGARGLAQLMPGTARGLGVSDPHDPVQAIDAGARYFRQQLDTFGGDTRKALAAYNAGPGAVQKYGGIPPYRETQQYVQRIAGSTPPRISVGETPDQLADRLFAEAFPSPSRAPAPPPRRQSTAAPGQAVGARLRPAQGVPDIRGKQQKTRDEVFSGVAPVVPQKPGAAARDAAAYARLDRDLAAMKQGKPIAGDPLTLPAKDLEERIRGPQVWDWQKGRTVRRRTLLEQAGENFTRNTTDAQDALRDRIRAKQRNGEFPLPPLARNAEETKGLQQLQSLAQKYGLVVAPITQQLGDEAMDSLYRQAQAGKANAGKWDQFPKWLKQQGVKLTPHQREALKSLIPTNKAEFIAQPDLLGNSGKDALSAIADTAIGLATGGGATFLKAAGRAVGGGVASGATQQVISEVGSGRPLKESFGRVVGSGAAGGAFSLGGELVTRGAGKVLGAAAGRLSKDADKIAGDLLARPGMKVTAQTPTGTTIAGTVERTGSGKVTVLTEDGKRVVVSARSVTARVENPPARTRGRVVSNTLSAKPAAPPVAPVVEAAPAPPTKAPVRITPRRQPPVNRARIKADEAELDRQLAELDVPEAAAAAVAVPPVKARGKKAASAAGAAPTRAPGYLDEQINYGGETRTRGSVMAEMQKAGTPQERIDRYMQGAKATAPPVLARQGTPAAEGEALPAAGKREPWEMRRSDYGDDQARSVWDALEGTPAPRETVVATDLHSGTRYQSIGGKLHVSEAPGRTRPATSAEQRAFDGAVQRGGVQVEREVISSVGQRRLTDSGEKRGILHRATGMQSDASHRGFVESALAAGKPVPASVLADYPDLAPPPVTPPKRTGKKPTAAPLSPDAEAFAAQVAESTRAGGVWSRTRIREEYGRGKGVGAVKAADVAAIEARARELSTAAAETPTPTPAPKRPTPAPAASNSRPGMPARRPAAEPAGEAPAPYKPRQRTPLETAQDEAALALRRAEADERKWSASLNRSKVGGEKWNVAHSEKAKAQKKVREARERVTTAREAIDNARYEGEIKGALAKGDRDAVERWQAKRDGNYTEVSATHAEAEVRRRGFDDATVGAVGKYMRRYKWDDPAQFERDVASAVADTVLDEPWPKGIGDVPDFDYKAKIKEASKGSARTVARARQEAEEAAAAFRAKTDAAEADAKAWADEQRRSDEFQAVAAKAKKETPGAAGLTPSQKQYLIAKAQEVKARLEETGENAPHKIKVPGDGTFTVETPAQAEGLAKNAKHGVPDDAWQRIEAEARRDRGWDPAASGEAARKAAGAPPIDAAPPKRTALALAALDAFEAKTDAKLAEVVKRVGGQVNALPWESVQVVALVGGKVAARIARGTLKAADFADTMVREYGEAVRPHLRAIWAAAERAWDENRAGWELGGRGLRTPDVERKPVAVTRRGAADAAADPAPVEEAPTPATARPAAKSAETPPSAAKPPEAPQGAAAGPSRADAPPAEPPTKPAAPAAAPGPEKPKPEYVGSINLSKIPEPLHALVRELYIENQPRIDAHRRTGTSWEASEREGERLIKEGIIHPDNFRDPQTGKAYNAAELRAIATLHSRATADLRAAREAAETSDDPATLINLAEATARAQAMTMGAQGAKAEAGRALNILKKFRQAYSDTIPEQAAARTLIETFDPKKAPKARNGETPKPRSPEFGTTNTLFTRDVAEAARKRLLEKASRLSSGVDPTILPDLVEVGGYYVEGGLRRFADWSAHMRTDFAGLKLTDENLQEVWGQVKAAVSERGKRAAMDVAKKEGASPRELLEKRLKKILGQEGLDEDLLAKVRAEEDPAKLQELIRQSIQYTPGQKFLSMWRSSILSNPTTQIRNNVGNAVQSGLSGTSRLVAGVVDVPVAALTKRPRAVGMEDNLAGAVGYLQGFPQGLAAAKEVMRQGFTTEQAARLDLPLDYQQKGLLKGLNYVPRMLGAADAIWRTMAYEGERAALATRKSISAGTGKAGMIAALDSPEVLEAATAKAARMVYQEEPDKYLAALMDYRRKVPALNLVIPFVQTPWNIIKETGRMSPLGLARLRGKTLKDPEVSHIIADAIVGSAILASTAALVQGTEITAAAPRDAAARDAFYRSGRVPYSIKVGDKWVSYQSLGPATTLLAVVAAWKDDHWRKKESTPTGAFWRTAAEIGKSLTQQSFLSGINGMLELFTDPERSAVREGARLVGGAIPYSGALRAIQQATDKNIRRPEGFGEQIQANIPGASRLLQPRVDALGRDALRYPGGIGQVQPLLRGRVDPDPTSNELTRLGIWPGLAGKNFKIDGETPALTSAQATNYQRMIGKAIHVAARKIMESKTERYGDGKVKVGYADMTDDERKDALEKEIKIERGKALTAFKKTLTPSTALPGRQATPGAIPRRL